MSRFYAFTARTFVVGALLLAAACSGGRRYPSATLIHHVKGYTPTDSGWAAFEAMVIDSGKVLATGPADSLRSAFPGAKEIDGKGRTLLPGLTDAHGHVMGLGRGMLEVDLVGTRSLADLQKRVAAYAKENPHQLWIVGRGWNQELFDKQEFPTAADLDAIVPDRPVYLVRVDGHAAVVNTAALRLAGISRNTQDPQGGRLLRDAKGNPTGLLVDGAMGLVGGRQPQPTPEADSLALEKAMAHLRSLGITSIHDAGIPYSTYKLYRSFATQGKLTTRIYAMIGGAGEAFDQIAADGILPSFEGDRLSVQAVKLYADGALGSRGAALIHPYHDEPGKKGLLFYTDAQMQAMVDKVGSKGYQLCIHAIGDAANRQVLNALASAQERYPNLRSRRNRVEHAQIVDTADIPRFRQLGLIASMQPTHATSDMNMAEKRLGKPRMKGAYAWQTFLRQGTVVAAGSDFPVESANPWLGVFAAVTRMDTLGMPPGGWYPNEALTVAQALRAFTLDAAYAGHQEKALGSLQPGKWADFILVDRDPFTIPAKDLWQTLVLETWVAGQPVFQRPE